MKIRPLEKESLNSLAADLEANRLTEKLNSNQSSIISEAAEYLKLFYTEQNIPIAKMEERLAEICCEVQQTGTYWQTEAEITYGAQLAWRNSTRCIGRIFWQSLIVRDLRHLSTAEEIFEAIVGVRPRYM